MTLTVDGEPRSALVHVPSAWSPESPVPLILAFHGHGGTGAALEGFSGLDSSSAIVAYPQGTSGDGGAGWQGAPYASGADDVAFVNALLDQLEQDYCVDTARVYATGISNGAGFVSLLMCALPSRFAAYAVVAGAVYEKSDPDCPSGPPVSVLDFHGTADPVMHYDGGDSHGAPYLSADAWVAQQTRRDDCAAAPETSTVGSDVTVQAWNVCHGGSAVVHYRIAGGGHTWPGAAAPSGPGPTTRSISATKIMLDFFAAHPRGA